MREEEKNCQSGGGTNIDKLQSCPSKHEGDTEWRRSRIKSILHPVQAQTPCSRLPCPAGSNPGSVEGLSSIHSCIVFFSSLTSDAIHSSAPRSCSSFNREAKALFLPSPIPHLPSPPRSPLSPVKVDGARRSGDALLFFKPRFFFRFLLPPTLTKTELTCRHSGVTQSVRSSTFAPAVSWLF